MTNEFRIIESPSAAVLGELSKRLSEAGQALGPDEFETFLFADGDPLLAGCAGEIAFRSAHVSQLWVSDELRGQGVGSRLLHAAEAHARRKACDRIHLETRSEGARRLYERLGFRVFGTLENYAGDQALYYLEKAITAEA